MFRPNESKDWSISWQVKQCLANSRSDCSSVHSLLHWPQYQLSIFSRPRTTNYISSPNFLALRSGCFSFLKWSFSLGLPKTSGNGCSVTSLKWSLFSSRHRSLCSSTKVTACSPSHHSWPFRGCSRSQRFPNWSRSAK